MFGLPNPMTVLIVGAVAFAAGGAAGGRLAWTHQDGKVVRAETARDKAQSLAKEWEEASLSWERAFRRSEKLRSDEKTQASNAVTAEQKDCNARIAAARASARALRSLLNEPVKTDAAGCPVRRLYTPDELRNVLRPTPDPG